ncbi:MAG: tetratricopeptide repeat protein [Treponema sp.]|jgi:tetratricopeptide (TPR) repeat protein|nr:tetratricopeptide repeat protein [Treponema sp.]
MGNRPRRAHFFATGSVFLLFCALSFFPPQLEAQNGAGGNTGLTGGAAGAAEAAVYYERGRHFMALEDWYTAAEALIECLRFNPAHAEGTAALAECYYELGEFDEALVWARKARALARTNMAVANLEAYTLIALGQLDAAAVLIGEILGREPYNREATFAAGQLDIARGRSTEALSRYREAERRYPDDRRLLLSLALVSGSLGDTATALSSIDRALAQHPDDYRVFYYAAYVNAQADRIPQAVRYAEQTLSLRPGYGPARSLLANLRYRSGQYEEAARLADEAIAANRDDMSAWYLKGLAYMRMNRSADALTIFSNAIAVNANDEFIRTVLEDSLIAVTSLEDPRRSRWASWHFERARDFRSRNMSEQAVFEYRRGLRLNPYARDRREYAELLRLQGYPARYLEELRFLQDQGIADRSLNDAVETYSSLLSAALFRRWQVNPMELTERHWKIAVFSIQGQSSFYHVDAGAVASAYIRELLIHDRNISPLNLELRQSSFSPAFRQAREAGADYFMIISTMENERDISLKAELFVARTGAPAGTFYTYRTGPDRLRNASRGIADQLAASLPFRAKLLMRHQAQGLIDKGRADGVTNGAVYDVVKKGRPQIASEGIGLIYTADDLVGRITIESADEEVAAGSLARNGFFDRIEPGDEIIFQAEKGSQARPEIAANPELRALLRTLR